MAANQFFAKCIRIERKLAELYAHFSKIERYPAVRRALWRKLSEDEVGHALDLELASRLSMQGESLVATIPVVDLDKLYNSLQQMIHKVVQHPLSDRDAVALAVELELKTARIHSRSAVAFEDPRLRQLFQALGKYDLNHLGGLIDAYEELFNHTPSALNSPLGA